MRRSLGYLAVSGVLILVPLRAAPDAGQFSFSNPSLHSGTSDASAAVALTETLFVVGSDEDNVLRVYRNDRAGPPVEQIDLTGVLKVDPRFPETDLEGAARVGDRVYWVTSHGRNQEGEKRPNRRRFFATALRREGEGVRLEFIGVPCTRLLAHLAKEARYNTFQLARASTRAPKERDGLNIEGLCAAADGSLLIGFRNPVPNGCALVAPLLNPAEVIAGHDPRFGDPVLLALDGYGIRDFAMERGHGLIIAGAPDGKGKQRLYAWDGVGTPPRWMADLRLKDLNPEAVVLYPGQGVGRFQILSDDGREEWNTPLKGGSAESRTFRSVWVHLQ